MAVGYDSITAVLQASCPSEFLSEWEAELPAVVHGWQQENVEDYKDCYLAKEPARAVIGRMDADSHHIYKVLPQVFHAT